MITVDLFSIGNALIDQEFKVSDHFLLEHGLKKGTMQLSESTTQQKLYQQLQTSEHYKGQASGGSAANTTVAFTGLGGTAFYACRVGNDELGKIYLNGLNEAKIKTSETSLTQGATGTCIVLVSSDAERTMQTYLGTTTDLSTNEIDYQPLKTAKWLYIEGYLATSPSARLAVKQAREIAKQHNVKIAISLSDPAMVQYARDGLNELIDDGVDLLFCNEQEALAYTDRLSIEEAFTQLKAASQTVVITQGERGASVSSPEQHFQQEGRHIHVLDTLGAGDAFSGAFLYALTQNMSLEQATQLAILISSEIVAQYGPRLPIQNYAKLLEEFQNKTFENG